MSLFSFKQSIIKIVIIGIVVLLCSLLLMSPAINTIANEFNAKGLQKKANISFQIPAPGREQLRDIESQTFIENAFPYYDVFSTVKLPSNKSLQNFYCMLIDSSEASTFPFTSPTMRIQEKNIDSLAVYADYAFQTKYNVKVGDQITLDLGGKLIAIPITAIVENCASYIHIQQNGGGVLIVSIPTILFSELQAQAGKPIQYSGAFLRVSNHSQAKNYLADYKPLGKLRDENTFKNSSDYSAYLNDFNKTSYEAEIRDFSIIQQTFLQNSNVLINALLILGIILACLILNATISFSNKETQNALELRVRNGDKKQNIVNAINSYILPTVIFSVVLLLIMFIAFQSEQKNYCPITSYTPIFLIDLGGILVFGFLFSSTFAKRITKKFF